jgi:16S rRNA (guanine527-N7)-methyltransferase
LIAIRKKLFPLPKKKSGTWNLEFEIWNLKFEIIHRYFPDLTKDKLQQFMQLGELYSEWNARINVISRKDIENLYERHVLHSLGIAKVISFKPGTRVLDAGTGGGFPGIPLAIMFPETHFHLIDSTAKKLTVVDAVVKETGLANVSSEHCRLEDHHEQYDFVVSRAVTSIPEFYKLVCLLIDKKNNNSISNGILYLKGGDVEAELNILKKNYNIMELSIFFQEDFFLTKKVIHIF